MTARIVAVIPHYNHATTIGEVVAAVRAAGLAAWIVDDGSDVTAQAVLDVLAREEGVRVYRRAQNGGKGAAMNDGFHLAAQAGYSHVLQIDADAQHCFADIEKFAAAACAQPDSLICGQPIYGADAPKSRLYGRKLTTFWIQVNACSRALPDGMCGFRVYPLAAVIPLLAEEHIAARMDFDIDILVRLAWRRVPMVWLETPVHYARDGVSHFRAGADNWRISKTHARLFCGMVWRRLSGRWQR